MEKTNWFARISYSGVGVGVDVFQWGDVDLLIEDASKLPFEKESFDTVTIMAALNHIPNRESALIEINRILAPSGKLLITMLPPQVSKIWHKLREPWDCDQYERGMKEGEVFGLTNTEMNKILDSAGFVVMEKTLFMFGINSLYVVKKK